MIIESDFPHPQPSFPFPVDPITYEPGAEPLVCVKFNAHYLPYILGSLLQLALRSTWDTEVDSDAQLQLMRVNDLILLFQRASDQCGITAAHIYEEMSEMPAFRVDCDCNVFVTCCDGTEVQLAKLSDVPKSSTPSDSNTQPSPGGGTAKYCQTMSAQGKLLLPTKVNTGDVITLESASGAGNDGVEAAWRCVDGSQFFAGACVGFPHTDGADPVPTANHMALIVVVGGTPHAFASGAFTVPGGVTDAEAYIQVNDSTLLGNFGSYDICAQVQNNQLATWEQVFDFTLAPGGWAYGSVASGTPGAWVGGGGFENNDFDPVGGGCARGVFIIRNHASTTITSIDVTYDYTLGSGSGLQAVVDVGGGNQILHNFNDVGSGSAQHFSWSGSQVSTRERIYLISSFQDPCAALNGAVRFYKVRITGTGTNPYL